MSGPSRIAVVSTTLLAGGIVGAALVFLPAQAPVDLGPQGPPPGDGAPPSTDIGPQVVPPDQHVPQVAIPEDEDWLDAHLRRAQTVWADAATQATADPTVAHLAPTLQGLADRAPDPSAELPPLQILIPYLRDELSIWLELRTTNADFSAIEGHLRPLLPPENALPPSRDRAAVPME